MPFLVRANPETECSEGHHPHLLVCGDPDDNCWADLEDGRGFMPYHILECCVCKREWPCPTKKAHLAERKLSHSNPPKGLWAHICETATWEGRDVLFLIGSPCPNCGAKRPVFIGPPTLEKFLENL